MALLSRDNIQELIWGADAQKTKWRWLFKKEEVKGERAG
jgi:hypothetical protein